jgi:hypothetical protein
MSYQLTNGDCIVRCADNAFIPFDDANIDYQAYQAWLDEGNTPLPAPEPEKLQEPTFKEKLSRLGITIEDLKAELGIA